jgi:hypothetical protein
VTRGLEGRCSIQLSYGGWRRHCDAWVARRPNWLPRRSGSARASWWCATVALILSQRPLEGPCPISDDVAGGQPDPTPEPPDPYGTPPAAERPPRYGEPGYVSPYAATGVYCPGCGSLRGLNDLLTGHVWAAVGSNALLLPALAWLAWAWLSAARVGVAGWRVGPAPSSARFSYVLLAIIAVFTVARNVPGSPLAP